MLTFDPKVDYGPRLNVVIWLMCSLSALFLFTRLYLKNFQNRGLWWDDYALLAAWIFQTGQAGLVTYIITLGYGKAVIPIENGRLLALPVNLLSTFLITSNLLGKLSFALTLLRIPALWMRIILWFTIITLTTTLTVSSIIVWIECFGSKRKTNCVPISVSLSYNMFSCVYSAVMDVALAFLPWKFIWDLQMSKKEKIGVVVAMSMGVFAGAAAALKTATLSTVATNPMATIGVVIWGNVESAICIMAASIPILRALVRGGMRGAVPLGYESYETGYVANMTEPRTGTDRSTIFARQLAFPLRPGQAQKRQAGSGPDARAHLDKTLTSASPEPMGKTATKGDDGEQKERDSIEMTDYDGRPQSPKDFLRGNPV